MVDYHDGDSVDVLHGADVALLPALLVDHAQTAKEAADEDNDDESKDGVDSAYFKSNWVGHEYSHCLADADQDEILSKLIAEFGNDDVRAVVDVLSNCYNSYR
jgi:hypothetical protein